MQMASQEEGTVNFSDKRVVSFDLPSANQNLPPIPFTYFPHHYQSLTSPSNYMKLQIIYRFSNL